MHTHGGYTNPACVNRPTHRRSHLCPCIHIDIGGPIPHVYGNITIFSIFSFLLSQLMKNFVLLARLSIMVIEWYEREHKGANDEALNDPNIVNILRQCRLLKYF